MNMSVDTKEYKKELETISTASVFLVHRLVRVERELKAVREILASMSERAIALLSTNAFPSYERSYMRTARIIWLKLLIFLKLRK